MAEALLLHVPSTFLRWGSTPTSSTSFSVPQSVAFRGHQRIGRWRSKIGGGIRTSSLNAVTNSASASVVDQSTEQRVDQLDQLWTWMTQSGVVSGSGGSSNGVVVKPSLVKEGFGLVAQREVRKGEDLLQVPRGSWICLETVKQSAIGRFLEGQRPWVALALFLITERVNPSSKWLPYISSLPQILNSTLFWSDEELMELQGTQLLGSTLSFKEYVENEFQKVQKEVIAPNGSVFDGKIFTFEAFLWAFGILRSRTFAPLTGDDLALVPLADLVNHGDVPDSNIPGWELRKGTGFFGSKDLLIVRAVSNFQAGEEILMEYGDNKGNGQLALDYGFVEKRTGSSVAVQSTMRDTFTLTLEIPESDRFFDDKLDAAELNGLSSSVSFDLVSGQGPPEQMITFLRLMVIEGPDAFLLEALFRNAVWDHISLPVSKENEEGVCTAILDGCRAALAAYSTTIDEDIRLLEEGIEDPRLEMAVVIRLGEKRVLEELQAWFEAHLARVETLEFYAERRLRDLGLLDDKGFMTPWVFGE
ncbi:unnamed protein product [Calypogeia fissa]